jgi:hypothetical protein
MANPTAPNRRAHPGESPDQNHDPLLALLRAAVRDPDTDGRVAAWLRRLIGDDQGEVAGDREGGAT